VSGERGRRDDEGSEKEKRGKLIYVDLEREGRVANRPTREPVADDSPRRDRDACGLRVVSPPESV